MDLAWVLTERGLAVRAEPLARLAIAEFRSEKAAEAEADSLRGLAEAQLSQGQLADAQNTIDMAMRILEAVDSQPARLSARVMTARIRAARRETAEAQRALQTVVADANKSQLWRVQLKARLALADIESRVGHVAAARRSLAELQRDALKRGFVLIARKADGFARRLPKSD
jgi:hypothetical protein